MQKHDHGERPIAFISRALTGAECNYSMWEKELFAVVWSIKYFRPYLLNHEFLVKSDNKPSTQLHSQLRTQTLHIRYKQSHTLDTYLYKDTTSKSNTKQAKQT